MMGQSERAGEEGEEEKDETEEAGRKPQPVLPETLLHEGREFSDSEVPRKDNPHKGDDSRGKEPGTHREFAEHREEREGKECTVEREAIPTRRVPEKDGAGLIEGASSREHLHRGEISGKKESREREPEDKQQRKRFLFMHMATVYPFRCGEFK